jgi:FKBP-type peptidyl-prolyl cis-trans isomerase
MFTQRIRPLAVAVALVLAGQAQAQQAALETDVQKYSYAVGTRIAAQLLNQFGSDTNDVDMKALAAGISDTVNGGERLMTDEEAMAMIQSRQQALEAEAAASAEKAAAAGASWREENAKVEGVTQTESGLQYSVIASGNESAPSPGPSDTVVVHYRGTLLDGTEFDSSHSRGVPATFPLSGIIPGWKEALQLMRAGDKWNVVIPPELAYGERGAGGTIGPNETLLFEIELIEVKGG